MYICFLIDQSTAFPPSFPRSNPYFSRLLFFPGLERPETARAPVWGGFGAVGIE